MRFFGARQQECPEILAIQLAGSSEIQERMMLLLKEGRGHPGATQGPPRLDDPDGEIEENSDGWLVWQTKSPGMNISAKGF